MLPYKTWWKPRFPMDERPLIKAHIANFGISLDVFEFLDFGWFFPFFFYWVFGYSWSTLSWYWCYYPHWSRDALPPVCGIFLFCPSNLQTVWPLQPDLIFHQTFLLINVLNCPHWIWSIAKHVVLSFCLISLLAIYGCNFKSGYTICFTFLWLFRSSKSLVEAAFFTIVFSLFLS